MRILFTALPGFEPVAAMVPLARELMQTGHEVVLATSATLTPVVEALGVKAASVGPRWSTARSWELLGELAPRSPGEERSCLGRAVIRNAMQAVSPVLKLAATQLPDLVIHDQYELAGALAAEALGLRSISFHHQYDSAPVTTHHALPTLRRKLGISKGRRPAPEIVLDSLPSALAPYPPGTDDGHRSIRPVPVRVPSRVEPVRWREPRDRPRVLIALGNAWERRVTDLLPVLEALGDLAVDAIIADSPLPAHARCWARTVPMSAVAGLLTDADLMIASGSSFLSVAALATSTPLLLIPRHPDEVYLAHRVNGAGAGLAVRSDQLDRHSVRAQVSRILDSAIFGDNARRMSDEIRDMPAPEDVAKTLLNRQR